MGWRQAWAEFHTGARRLAGRGRIAPPHLSGLAQKRRGRFTGENRASGQRLGGRGARARDRERRLVDDTWGRSHPRDPHSRPGLARAPSGQRGRAGEGLAVAGLVLGIVATSIGLLALVVFNEAVDQIGNLEQQLSDLESAPEAMIMRLRCRD